MATVALGCTTATQFFPNSSTGPEYRTAPKNYKAEVELQLIRRIPLKDQKTSRKHHNRASKNQSIRPSGFHRAPFVTELMAELLGRAHSTTHEKKLLLIDVTHYCLRQFMFPHQQIGDFVYSLRALFIAGRPDDVGFVFGDTLVDGIQKLFQGDSVD
jgi:hypothetical protein